MKAEVNVYYETEPHVAGTAETHVDDDDHTSHTYLYIPDKSSTTGWASHRVPERVERPVERRPMGFLR